MELSFSSVLNELLSPSSLPIELNLTHSNIFTYDKSINFNLALFNASEKTSKPESGLTNLVRREKYNGEDNGKHETTL